MTKKTKKTNTTYSYHKPLLAFVAIFSLVGIIVLLRVSAAVNGRLAISNFGTQSVAIRSGADADGEYIEFGRAANPNPAPAIGPPTPEPFAADPHPSLKAGELPSYTKPPLPNNTTIRKASSREEMMQYAQDASVQIIVLADGNYQVGGTVHMDGIQNKIFWAENKYGAIFKPSSDYSGNVNLGIANSKKLTFRGISFEKAGNYSIRVGGEGTGIQGPNEDITIEYSRIKDPAQSGIGVNNGYGSSWSRGCPVADFSKRILIQYNEIINLGSKFDRPQFTEGIYTTSGGGCQQADQVEDVVIRGNIFTQPNPSTNQGAELIGCKTYTRNLFIEKNHITNVRIAQATDGGAISVWEDLGASKNIDYGSKGIVVRNNYIDGVRTVPGTTSAKANGISVAHSAIVEFNTVKNTQHASVKFTHGEISRVQGFSNPNQSVVYVRNNNFSGYGTGAYGFDLRQASFPITYYSAGNIGVDKCPAQQNAVWKACEK